MKSQMVQTPLRRPLQMYAQAFKKACLFVLVVYSHSLGHLNTQFRRLSSFQGVKHGIYKSMIGRRSDGMVGAVAMPRESSMVERQPCACWNQHATYWFLCQCWFICQEHILSWRTCSTTTTDENQTQGIKPDFLDCWLYNQSPFPCMVLHNTVKSDPSTCFSPCLHSCALIRLWKRQHYLLAKI